MCDTGEPPLERAPICRKFHKNRVEQRTKDADRLGVPLIISEFGACSNSEACAAEITSVADACDDYLASWMYWMFKGFGDFTTTGSLTEGLYDGDGNLEKVKVKALLRSYAFAYQGEPISSKYSSDSMTYTTEFKVDPKINAPTEIYVTPLMQGKESIKVQINGKEAKEAKVVKKSSNYYTLQLDSA